MRSLKVYQLDLLVEIADRIMSDKAKGRVAGSEVLEIYGA